MVFVKKNLLFVLGAGIGWFLGAYVSMAILYSNNLLTSYSFQDAFGNALVLSFPGTVLLLIALYFAIKDTTGASF